MRHLIAWLLTLTFAATAAAQETVRWPISGWVTEVTQDRGGYSGHKGTDISSGGNAGVFAAASGTIAYAIYNNQWNGGAGNYVVIHHGSAYKTRYLHLASAAVAAGQQVTTATQIGIEGATGNVTGTHVHFEFFHDANGNNYPDWGSEWVASSPFWQSQLYVWVNRGNAVPGWPGVPGLGTSPAPAPAPSGLPRIKMVNTSALNVRTGPSTGYSIIGQVYWGQKYVAVEAYGAWYKIYYRGNTGWCYGGYLAASSGTAAKVTISALNVRTGPSTGYAIVGQVYYGQMYVHIEWYGSWRRIWWGGGTYWVYGGYTTSVGM